MDVSKISTIRYILRQLAQDLRYVVHAIHHVRGMRERLFRTDAA